MLKTRPLSRQTDLQTALYRVWLQGQGAKVKGHSLQVVVGQYADRALGQVVP